jgi:single-strand DNA-binding protein
MNSCNFTGRLTADVELKTSANNIPVASFALAVKRPMVKDTTDFINFTAWRSTAEYLAKYAKKGDVVAVTGVLTQRNWEDRDGNKRTSFEVVCNNAETLKSSANNKGEQTPAQTQNAEINPYNGTPVGFEEVDTESDDLPF